MKTKIFRVLVTAGLLLAAADGYAQPWTPTVNDEYGTCGDGIWERPPLPSPDDFLDVSTTAEQCDSGKFMLGVNGAELQDGQIQGCYYNSQANNQGCRIRINNHANGIIEKIKGEWEECDEGRQDEHNYCEAGKLVGSIDYFNFPGTGTSNLCGNGVLDPGENCDIGQNPQYASVCGEDCKTIEKTEVNGYTCHPAMKLCGNGIIDPNTGEQCDLGSKVNGMPGASCTRECTLKDLNPIFATPSVDPSARPSPNFYFFPYNQNYTGKLDHFDGGGWGSPPLNPTIPENRFSLPDMDIYDRGRVINVKRHGQKEYSGILAATDDSNAPMPSDGEFLEINFTMKGQRPQEGFDNDWFGLVIGQNGSQIVQENGSANYLMLSWRTEHWPGYGDRSSVHRKGATECNGEVDASDITGLRLYSITGTPTYNELWGMKDCGKSNHIVEIPTQIYQIPPNINHASLADEASLKRYNSDWLSKVHPKFKDAYENDRTWNNIVNPAYRLSPYSHIIIQNKIKNNYIYRLWENNVVQIRVLINKQKMKVFLNKQLVMDVDGTVVNEILANIDGANGATRAWPDTASWGFYFLGMDNFIADFRSNKHRVIATQEQWKDNDYRESLNNPLGTRCDFCGDGIVNGPESCDGGPTGVEGCPSAAIADEATRCKPLKGWMCSYNEDKTGTVCYGGEFTSPKPNPELKDETVYQTSHPVFSGHYYGTPGDIKVTIYNDAGNPVTGCENLVAQKDEATGTWSVDSNALGCDLRTNGHYKATFTIDPPASITGTPKPYTSKETGFEIEIPASGNNNDKFQITEPKGKYVSGDEVNVSGTCAAGSGKVSVNIEGDATKGCPPETACKDDGTWSCAIAAKDFKNPGKTTIEATNRGVTRTKTVIYDSEKPDKPKLYSDDVKIRENDYVSSENGVIHLTGETSAWGGTNDSPEKVTVKILDPDDGNKVIDTKTVSVGQNGKFEVAFPLPKGATPTKKYTIVATAEDEAGNKSDPRELTGIHFVDGDVPDYIKLIPAPSDTHTVGLDGSNTNTGPEIKIKVGPKHPTDKNDILFKACIRNDNSSCLGAALPSCPCNEQVCDGAIGAYNPATGICTVTFADPKPTHGQVVEVKAKATVGGESLGPVEGTYINDVRGDSIANQTPVVSVNNTPLTDPSDEVSSDNQQIVVKVTGTKVDGSNTKTDLIPGDKVTVELNGETRECTVAESASSCTVSFPTNQADDPITKDGDLNIKATVQSPLGHTSLPAEKTLKLVPYMTVTTPQKGATVAAGEKIGGAYTCPSSDTTGACTGNMKVLFCEGDVDVSVANCKEIQFKKTSDTNEGTWSADTDGLKDGEYTIYPVNTDDGTITDIYPSVPVTVDNSKPVISSPCLAGAPGCDPNGNKSDDGDAIHVKATGPANAAAKVTVTDSKGNVTDGAEAGCTSFNARGVLECNIPVDKNNGPFVVKVTAKPGEPGEKIATTPPINVFNPNKPVILSPCEAGTPECNDPADNSDDGKIHIDITGPPGQKVTVVITDKDGKERVVKCGTPPSEDACKYRPDGHFIKNVPPVDDDGNQMTGPFKITATTKGPAECTNNEASCTTETNPIKVFDPYKPVFESPCSSGTDGCDPNQNSTPNGDIKIRLSGPADYPVKVTITDKDGKVRTVTCDGSPCKFGPDGKLAENVKPVADDGTQMEGPYIIVATTEPETEPAAGICSAHPEQCTAEVINVEVDDNGQADQTPDKPKFNRPCKAGTPGCPGKPNSDGSDPGVTKDGDGMVIHIDVSGPPGRRAKVTVTDDDGNPVQNVADDCPERYSAKGELVCNVTIPPGTKYPVTVTVETLGDDVKDGKASVKIDKDGNIVDDANGFVAGGCGSCSSTDTPESGLLALLLAALGFFAIRRRRD